MRGVQRVAIILVTLLKYITVFLFIVLFLSHGGVVLFGVMAVALNTRNSIDQIIITCGEDER